MVARSPDAQPDLFLEMPRETPRVAKRSSPKTKQPCAHCTETFLTVQEVADRYKVFRSTVWRWVATVAEFPPPVRLTPGTTRWLLRDLVRFEQAQQAASRPKRHQKGGC